MGQHSFKYVNPYDMEAVLIKNIIDALKDSPDPNASLSDIEGYKMSETEILWVNSFFDQYFSKNFTEQGLVNSGIPHALVDIINTHINAIAGWRDKYTCCRCLLERFDKYLYWRYIIESVLVRNSSRGLVSLNYNVDTTGIFVIPRVSSIANPEPFADGEDDMLTSRGIEYRWEDRFTRSLNSVLKNIYYYEACAIPEGYVVRHIFCSAIMNNINPCVFRIVLSPMTIVPHVIVNKYETEEERLFSLSLMREETLFRKFCKVLRQAINKKADILICPEILGTEEFSPKHLSGDESPFQDVLDEAVSNGLRMPSLILSPTRYEDRTNTLSVWDRDGGRILVCHKQHPFSVDGYVEDLRNREKTINILHVPGLGRLAFPICRDLLHPEYRALLVYALRCSLIICPSFTKSNTIFSFIDSWGWGAGCSVIWLNTCSARKEGDACPLDCAGIVSVPFKENVSKKLKPICNMECMNEESVCCFIVDIDIRRRIVDTDFFVTSDKIGF